MRLVIRSYWAPKKGAPESDYEDAWAYSETQGTLAVADGASASAGAGPWARALVGTFVREAPMALNHFDDWFNLVQADQGVKGNAGAEQSGWWVTEVRRRGAFATLCGVSIDVLAMRWKAISVGDTCVFHVRGDDLLGAFPIDDPTKFDSTPDLLGSNVDPPLPWHARGDLLPRDVLLVASDALAAWALTESSNRPGIWSFLASLRSDQFRVFIEDARSKGGLENDDVTLIRCEVRDG